MKKSNKQTIVKYLKWALLVIIIAGLFWAIQWATYARPPLQNAIDALESNDLVIITEELWLTFTPTSDSSTIGFIFYPGGRVDPRGYSGLMNTIASEGYLVIVPEMPINMAVFNPNVADEIIAYYPQIDHWVIAGHSVGGTMAAQYTYKHQEEIHGLMIWASYPADSTDLSASEIPVVSIYGSKDPEVNDESIAERKGLLPDNTLYVRIEGGDHHQFGSYEINPEEDHAEISRESQHEQIIQATLELLRSINSH